MLRRLTWAAAALMSCTDVLPCTACPPMEGTYTVAWQAAPPSGTCTVPGPRPPEWTIERTGSSISTSLDGSVLTGTVYDTYDFTLSGGVDGPSFALRGRVVVGLSDAGVQLMGSLRTRSTGALDASCNDIDERFVADKQHD
ncbi:MAG: hypothetical protein JNG84_07345 [Archangium sp.]|nr:hypothetical protein [Archangium sp.]